jgi:hypothetical protein
MLLQSTTQDQKYDVLVAHRRMLALPLLQLVLHLVVAGTCSAGQGRSATLLPHFPPSWQAHLLIPCLSASLLTKLFHPHNTPTGTSWLPRTRTNIASPCLNPSSLFFTTRINRARLQSCSLRVTRTPLRPLRPRWETRAAMRPLKLHASLHSPSPISATLAHSVARRTSPQLTLVVIFSKSIPFKRPRSARKTTSVVHSSRPLATRRSANGTVSNAHHPTHRAIVLIFRSLS